ncbi:hypothetical protein PILCRDRAFT_829156 [Piloderma croceum F 1598]|uniref:Uncharacterized protein n=1 Tax=Piloderma croceum (strain F 1598) TaxID=765440 RepID=A0A0C3ELF8_PILCF|nr:hypothetical protein PILCRDRAFT_829156 [Piloderma croceum F 1598]
MLFDWYTTDAVYIYTLRIYVQVHRRSALGEGRSDKWERIRRTRNRIQNLAQEFGVCEPVAKWVDRRVLKVNWKIV